MCYRQISGNLLLINNQIKQYSLNKNNYENKKKISIEELSNKLVENEKKIENLLLEIENEENKISKIKIKKEKKLNTLIKNISILQEQLKIITGKNNEINQQQINHISSEIEEYKKKNLNLNTKLKSLKKREKIIKLRHLEKVERNNMLEEEFINCKKILIILTSKIESHTEFIKNLCKTKNILTSSLEKLNQIEPQFNENNNEINIVDEEKLGENLYNFCNEYFEFTEDKNTFINTIKEKEDFKSVINHLINVSKYQLPYNLCEYLLIAICRIMTYEKVLDIRMKFMNNNSETESSTYNLQTFGNNEKEVSDSQKKEKNIELIIKKDEKIIEETKLKLNEKEKKLNFINKNKEENDKYIKDMENDLKTMILYKENISEEIKDIEIKFCNMQKNILNSINILKQENKIIKNKIEEKKLKLDKNSNIYQNEINNLSKIKNSLIDKKTNLQISAINNNNNVLCFSNLTTNYSSGKKNNINSKFDNTSIKFNLNYSPSLPEKDVILLEKIKPLFSKTNIYKRQIINIQQKIFENFSPVIRNKPSEPEDFGFKKFNLYIDCNNLKIIFEKVSKSENTVSLFSSSISRFEIPQFTKSLVFLQKIYKNLNKKCNISTIDDIDFYFNNNKRNIMELYINNENNTFFDDKIYNKDYREALLTNKKYMISIYLKPDEDTKIEIIFESRNDFKNWINGLDEFLHNINHIKKLLKDSLL